MRTVSVDLTDELDARLSAIARRRGRAVSEVVRDALEAFTGTVELSFAEAASDLAGSIDGPADLSTNSD
jgi:predicted transcriptional regulator